MRLTHAHLPVVHVRPVAVGCDRQVSGSSIKLSDVPTPGAAAAQVFEGVVKSRCFEREPVAVEGFFNTISPLCDDPFMYPIRE
jgi:hypothetical protein